VSVLVDTSIWAMAFGSPESTTLPRNDKLIYKLVTLIQSYKARIIGPVRQEVLSGIESSDQYEVLSRKLEAFRDIPIRPDDYTLAAEFYNRCDRKGLSGALNDFLICAVANNHDLAVFSAEEQFEQYSLHLPIRIYR